MIANEKFDIIACATYRRYSAIRVARVGGVGGSDPQSRAGIAEGEGGQADGRTDGQSEGLLHLVPRPFDRPTDRPTLVLGWSGRE